MANLNNIEGTISTTNTQLVANGYSVPDSFNNSRQPGKLANLFNSNSETIYNKLSNKTGYTGLFKFGPRQPFITSTPNHHSTLFSTRSFPIGSAVDDLQRITKWSLSGDGVVFLAKQFFLQGQNPFNETKIYNPLMPIQSVASTLSFGVIPTPTRHLDFSSFTSLLGFGSSDVAPATTVGKQAISAQSSLASNASKGLLRGAAASNAHGTMMSKWSTSSPTGGILANYFKSGFNKIFGGLIPQGQPANTHYRGDEGMYGIMLGAKDKFSTITTKDTELKWGSGLYQRWEAGSNTSGPNDSIKKSKQTSVNDSKKQLRAFQGSISQTGQYFGQSVGFTLSNNTKGYKIYGDNVGGVPIRLNKGGDSSYEYSDILSLYQIYTSVNGSVESNTKVVVQSKFNDKTDDAVKAITDTLKKTITNIKSAGYEYAPVNDSDLMMQQFSDSTYVGLDNITYKTKDPFSAAKGVSPSSYNGGYMTQFKFGKRKLLLDDDLGKGFASTNKGDKINKLGVLNADQFGVGKTYDSSNDDVIAFYFHDLVNDKYIPFRASIKGVSESATAEWNDVTYLGRADKLYTYKGFTRTLSFNFIVNITSIQEFAPTWQRINYFMGLIKPSNYTGNGNYSAASRFMIPPFLELTLGDMYVNQPTVLTSIGCSVPEDASWETLTEEFAKTNDWSYLNGTIKWADSKNKYAQLPRTVELSVSFNLLEKEKPIVGGSQFGSAYHTDPNYQVLNTSTPSFSSKMIAL